MAADRCSRAVSPILKQCFTYSDMMDGNLTTTYVSRMQPRAQDIESAKLFGLKRGSPVTIDPRGGKKVKSHNWFSVDFKPVLVFQTDSNVKGVTRLNQHTGSCIKDPFLTVHLSLTQSSIDSSNTNSTHMHRPDSKPSSAQLSFILMKLREEVCLTTVIYNYGKGNSNFIIFYAATSVFQERPVI